MILRTTLITAVVLVSGLAVRWLLVEHTDLETARLLLVDGAVAGLTLLTVALCVDRIQKPYSAVHQRVAEAVRARQPRSIPITGYEQHRELAREVDGLMRLLEERLGDPNLGPVVLRTPDGSGTDFADSFIEEVSSVDEDQPSLSGEHPAFAEPVTTETPEPVPDPYAHIPLSEPYRELYVTYAQALTEQERGAEVGSFQDFVVDLDDLKDSLRQDNPGYDVLFFLGDGPQLRPRLVPLDPIS
jgi:hypothetical protein